MVLAIGMSAQRGVPHCIPARTGGLQQTYVHLKGSTEVQSRKERISRWCVAKTMRCDAVIKQRSQLHGLGHNQDENGNITA